MKVFSCDLVDGKMIVDTSIVYQDVEFAESPFDLGKSSRDLFRFGEVALNGCGGAASISDRRNDSLGIGFAASIVDNDRCAGCSQVFCNGGPDAFGCSCYKCNFVSKSRHILALLYS